MDFFVFSGIFCMDGSAGVGAYRRPHAPSRRYHILQYIHILYTDFWGFICFFVRFSMGFFVYH